MATLSNDHARALPRRGAEQAGTEVQLRDLVQRHSGQLERLLKEEMQSKAPAIAQAFGGCAEAHRALGLATVAPWLYGVALRLLRDALGAGDPDQLASRFLRAFPRELAHPMLILALSGDCYVACCLYLCKPADAAARDISLSGASADWVRQHLH